MLSERFRRQPHPPLSGHLSQRGRLRDAYGGRDMQGTFRLVYLSLLLSLSLALFMFEGLIPLPFLAPGAKLGISNIITVIALYTLRPHDALLILLLRIVIGSLLGGGPTVMAYSLAGGLLSFGGMAALKHGGKFSVIGVSLAGGFMHNLGQLFIAAWAVESMGIFSYLPILGLCGLVTGAVIGLLAAMALPRLSFLPVPR